MAKLYPPHIEGTIPAFYGTTLVVPFSMNQAVGASEVKNIVLKIKKVNSNEVIFTKYAQGLFPALDQYPNLNKFTSQKGLYPDALTYLEEPSDKVEYNYQTIVDRDGNEITE